MSDEKILSDIFPSFNYWLQYQVDFAKNLVKEGAKNIKQAWYAPGKENVNIYDESAIQNEFCKDDIVDAFNKWMSGEGYLADARTIRLQNGLMTADERAFRLRHETVPRALAHGIMLSKSGWNSERFADMFKSYIKDTADCISDAVKRREGQ